MKQMELEWVKNFGLLKRGTANYLWVRNQMSVKLVPESARSTLSDRNSIIFLCIGVAVLALLFGFLMGSLYSCWKMPPKDQVSPCGSFRQPPQPVYNGNNMPQYLVNSSNNVINAYEMTPKFLGRNSRDGTPVSLTVCVFFG